MTTIPTPRASSISKTIAGLTDASYSDGVLKVLGCSVKSCSSILGLNSSASSLSLTLVEDTVNGDSFATPAIPSVLAFSVPKGGVGQPVMYPDDDAVLAPNAFNNTSAPFYFCGIVSSYKIDIRNVGGKLISVSVIDPREILKGVQCLMSNWSLSQNLGVGSPRYSNIDNIIDCFGYFDHGYESEYNEYGMPWKNIKTALLNVGVTLFGINFEFTFTGDAYNNTPAWYRISDQTLDIVSLAEKVARDGGSDMIVVARKHNSNTVLIEFKAISRKIQDPLTQSEISTFISDRTSIVSQASMGREFRNEKTSAIVVGGSKNTNYIAWPTLYNDAIHGAFVTTGGEGGERFKENLSSFPADIKERLFVEGETGSIFPYWGMSPSGDAPLAQPVLTLDHWSFGAPTLSEEITYSFEDAIPWIKMDYESLEVRTVSHQEYFLTGDDDPDSRPFMTYTYSSGTLGTGSTRGLPLNTEVMKAALVNQYTFENVYSLYYPDLAAQLGFGKINWTGVVEAKDAFTNALGPDNVVSAMKSIDLSSYFEYSSFFNPSNAALAAMSDTDAANARYRGAFIDAFKKTIYDAVLEYTNTYYGKKFIVCLPKSFVMNKIWNNEPVPTRPTAPEIEYQIAADQRGYWTYIPTEFDGVTSSGTISDQEEQIKERFMSEDGRFQAMVFMDWYPSGNGGFFANAENRALFQDLNVTDFRPNRIAEGNPDWVAIGCSVDTPIKRPDLAIVTMPGNGVKTDPNDNIFEENIYDDYDTSLERAEMYSLAGVMHMLKTYKAFDTDADTILSLVDASTWQKWANELKNYIGIDTETWKRFRAEPIIDLKAVSIPLDSKWVNYGPWYYDNQTYGNGLVEIVQDESLVPWNFERSDPWDANLNAAGEERLARELASLSYIDVCEIKVAGFPEIGIGGEFAGKQSNITSIAINFDIGEISTVYNLSTYDAQPGTYKKSDYDNISKIRKIKPDLKDTVNINVSYSPDSGASNKFPFRHKV